MPKLIENEREIVYPEIQASLFLGAKAIDEAKAKKMLGWEDEKTFKARMVKENPNSTQDQWSYGDDYLLKDHEGNKVRCWHVVNNRPFDETHMEGLAQSVLTRRWADSRNGPKTQDPRLRWSVNGETIILSLTGRVDSGQHRLIAEVIACQRWRKNPKKYPLWKEAPSFEAIVITGISEEVTQTLDNVKPRSVADILVTSNHFSKLSRFGKLECSRMLEKAIDFAWKRVGTLDTFKTQQASLDFLEAHPTLEPLVKHIYDENKDRGISLLRLSPGQMAGVAWLMATSATNRDAYQKAPTRCEKACDLSRLDKAKDFFTLLVSQDPKVIAVHMAIGSMVGDDAEGLGGRLSEKLAVLAKAWAAFITTGRVTEKDVALTYWTDEEGVVHLMAGPDGYLNYFGGVDRGEQARKTASEDGVQGQVGPEAKAPEGGDAPRPKYAKDLTETPLDKAKEEAKARRAEKAQAILDARARAKEAASGAKKPVSGKKT